MNMVSNIGITLFFALVFISEGHASFANVQCKTVNVGQYGRRSVLEFSVKTRQDAPKTLIRVVAWKKEGVEEPLLVFNVKRITKQLPGYSFAEPSWDNSNMNVSLLISDTAVRHQGVYECEVVTSGASIELCSTRLNVTAKYGVPAIISKPEKITQGTVGTLVCNSDGGYPKGQLRWLNERNEWIESAEEEMKQTENGLFRLSSKLTLQRGSLLSDYTCAVFNASGGKEEDVVFNIPDVNGIPNRQTEKELGEPEKRDLVSKVVAPLVVIGALIVGLLIAQLFYRRHLPIAVPTCETTV